jgi:hypothetical protein
MLALNKIPTRANIPAPGAFFHAPVILSSLRRLTAKSCEKCESKTINHSDTEHGRTYPDSID